MWGVMKSPFPLACRLVLFTSLAVVFPCAGFAQQAAASSAFAQAKTGVRGTRAVFTLRTALDSKSAKEGAPFKMTLREAVTLADDTVLPKGTELVGHVQLVTSHGKGKPNGALLLSFDEAHPKRGAAVPLVAKITALTPSVESETRQTQLPGARLGGTSNSGGVEQRTTEASDKSNISTNYKNASGIAGIFLWSKAGGAGALVAADADVYLDSDIHFELLIARRTDAAAPAQP